MITEVSPNATVKLDGSGNGQVSLTPPSGTVWRLRLASVSTTSTAKQPQAFLYRGSSSGPVEQIDSTYLGNSSSSGKVAGAPFFPGQVLWAVWEGGDAGAQATLQAYGQQGGRSDPFDSGPVGEGFPLSVATIFQAGNTVINSSGVITGAAGGPQIKILLGAGLHVAVLNPAGAAAANVVSVSDITEAVELPTGSVSEASPALMAPVTITYTGGETAQASLILGPADIRDSTGWFTLYLDLSSVGTWSGGVAEGFYTISGSTVTLTAAQVRSGLGVTCYNGGNAGIYQGILSGAHSSDFLPPNGSWTPMTLKNSWVNRGAGFVTAQYRLSAGPPVTTEIIGEVKNGILTNGTVLATLPAAYANPVNAQSVKAELALGTPAAPALTPVIEAEITGDLKLFNVPAGTTAISFHGFISLDA